MDFVLALHSHLPYVINHGRWPHGTSWLTEAVVTTYLPLIECAQRSAEAKTPLPFTVGVTPVLANQLAHASLGSEVAHFIAERRRALAGAPAELEREGEGHLLPIIEYWRRDLDRIERLLDRIGGDVLGALREAADAAGMELMSSAATHGYLPLLATDESVRLQLQTGFDEHVRLFGRPPSGCWLPECAYRSRGGSTADLPEGRAGVEEHLAAVGFAYFFTDAHLAAAGTALGAYHDVPLGAERFDAERHDPDVASGTAAARSPYTAYRVSRGRGAPVHTFVRDPRTSLQVWSRDRGYPGDPWYLEFHKIRWPGGVKLWRVTGPRVDLGDKRPYEPATARGRAMEHARHFAGLLERVASEAGAPDDGVIVAPFDTELFGHWWYEGFVFLCNLFDRLLRQSGVHPRTASAHLTRVRARPGIGLAEGSWGAGGDHRMWLNDATAWTWQRLWELERRFWSLVRSTLRGPMRPVVAQAARELLLAQASDWQFIISTGVAADYAERRFSEHADDLASLLDALAPDASTQRRQAAAARAAELAGRDELFPNVLDSLETVLAALPASRSA